MSANERPIIMTAESVRAILAGSKTQTRRVITPQPKPGTYECVCLDSVPQRPWCWLAEWFDESGRPLSTEAVKDLYGGWPDCSTQFKCPYGVPGDRLWVREAFWHIPEPSVEQLRQGADTWPKRVDYVANGADPDVVRGWGWKLRPAMFMPRWASRITLEVAAVRVQRLHDISEQDAEAEGFAAWTVTEQDIAYALISDIDPELKKLACLLGPGTMPARGAFRMLWGYINAKRGFGWEMNPWVWAVTFSVVRP